MKGNFPKLLLRKSGVWLAGTGLVLKYLDSSSPTEWREKDFPAAL